MLFLRTDGPNLSQSRRLFRGSLGQIKYFMTRVYWVIPNAFKIQGLSLHLPVPA
jgi:hypothetical protein